MTSEPHRNRPRQLALAGVAVTLLVGGVIWVSQWKPPAREAVGSARQAIVQFEPLDAKPAPDWGYVGSRVCRECHADIAREYQTHPMSQSLAQVLDAAVVEDYESSTHVVPKASGRHYHVERTHASSLHHELIVSEDGRVVSDYAVEVHLALGSGKRGRNYLIDRENAWLISPVSWYSGKNRWDLSPGYAPNKHKRFSREATERCINCHSGGLRGDSASRALPLRERLMELAIGCERCHGPGEKHVEYHREGNSRTGEDPVLRIADLAPSRRDAICNQCHLQGDAEVLRYGRNHGDFRPGMNVGEVWAIFVADDRANGNETAAVSQVMQMQSSRCFTGSDSRLGCVTCHNPHAVPSEASRVEWFRSRCLKCHSDSDCSETRAARSVRGIDDSCIHCHMPRVNAEDVPHTTQTDHRIVRWSGRRVESAGVAPRLDSLEVFDRRDNHVSSMEAARADGLMRAEQALLTGNPVVAKEARATLEEIVKVMPSDLPSLARLGELCVLLGDNECAADVWGRSLQIAPNSADSAEVLRNLSRIQWLMGDVRSARNGFRKLTDLRPWEAQSRLWLSRLLAEGGETEEALSVAQQAVSIDRHDAETCLWLAELHRRKGDLTKAKKFLEFSRVVQ